MKTILIILFSFISAGVFAQKTESDTTSTATAVPLSELDSQDVDRLQKAAIDAQTEYLNKLRDLLAHANITPAQVKQGTSYNRRKDKLIFRIKK